MPLSAALLLLGLASAQPATPPDAAASEAITAPSIADDGPFTHVVFGNVDLREPIPLDRAADTDVSNASPPAQAQPPDKADAKKPPTPPHTGVHALVDGVLQDFKHLPTAQNALIAAGGGAAALAVHPFDQSFNVRLRSHYTLVNDIYTPAKWIGESPVQVGAAIVVYILGRRDDQPKVSHFGMDWIRALIVQEVLTDTLKFATQRERPDHSDSLSFPSGHSATTFATATVIERHLGWKYAVLGYTLASYVASSRLHDNRHWLSDVVFGAAVGTISGRTVTQHGRDVWTFAPVGLPGGGVAVMVTRTGS